ncbi:hypothetical protein DFH27DRAFT_294377 [Peziza echinospora]|nr:hypothetical protein DFH27DRAFT_294377 [Peziza echinospora]
MAASTLLSNLLPVVGLAYGLQIASAIPSIYYKSDVYYDLSGSLTYLACTGLSLALPAIRRARGNVPAAGKVLYSGYTSFGGVHGRQLLLSGLVGIWATRIGSYLYIRAKQSGGDPRFEKIKQSPPKFLTAFLVQATWVTIVSLPVLTINSLPLTIHTPKFPNTFDLLGLTIFLSGFLFEIIADRQKSNWVAAKQNKKHNEDFISSGLWSLSRHPNYAGEITLWCGVAVIAGLGGGLVGEVGKRYLSGGRMMGLAIAGISPLFTTFLLTKVSGIPLTEKKYDAKYGEKKEYQEWKKNTPVLWPKMK